MVQQCVQAGVASITAKIPNTVTRVERRGAPATRAAFAQSSGCEGSVCVVSHIVIIIIIISPCFLQAVEQSMEAAPAGDPRASSRPSATIADLVMPS